MDVPRITPREFYYFCASMQITLFGISADVRRKTPRDYYHFADQRTIQYFGISLDVRRKTAQDYFPRLGGKFHPRYLPVAFTGIYRSGKYSSSGKYRQIPNTGKLNFFALKSSRNLKQDGLKQYNQAK